MTIKLIKQATADVTSDAWPIDADKANRSFMASGATATVTVQVSTDGQAWMDFCELTPTEAAADGYADVCPWPYVRAVATVTSGNLNVSVGC
ncbi:hypothetical protein [Pseudaeromonas paramecii]|uniref:Uncharacterized protein n=1 Tax=Pseudaeromonas paramecii TaxID=2138166 RepID=A0ABP8PWK2_9GAMM